MVVTGLHLLLLLLMAAAFVESWRHRNSVPDLSALTTAASGREQRLPRLSVVVPARNEEQAVRKAVASMIRQDYPDLEVILIDDRSTDRTGEIMAELAAAHPGRVRVVTVTDLPDGWLGKNHALWLGTRQSAGQWLLFADADVQFDPTCFRRAVAYSESAGLDHLTLTPNLHTEGYWLNAFIGFFLLGFMLRQRPWLANDPNSPVAMGVGAFNLVRRSAYEGIGTHAALSLRPDDDLRLAMRLKRSGYRVLVANGADLMGLRWYSTMWEAVRGLEKNMFAALEYSLVQALGSVAAMLLCFVYPFVALVGAAGIDRWLLLATVGVEAALFTGANWKWNRQAFIYLPVLPLLALLFGFTVLRSTAMALAQGGVRWRGTLYPLRDLKRQTGLEGLPANGIRRAPGR